MYKFKWPDVGSLYSLNDTLLWPLKLERNMVLGPTHTDREHLCACVHAPGCICRLYSQTLSHCNNAGMYWTTAKYKNRRKWAGRGAQQGCAEINYSSPSWSWQRHHCPAVRPGTGRHRMVHSIVSTELCTPLRVFILIHTMLWNQRLRKKSWNVGMPLNIFKHCSYCLVPPTPVIFSGKAHPTRLTHMGVQRSTCT